MSAAAGHRVGQSPTIPRDRPCGVAAHAEYPRSGLDLAVRHVHPDARRRPRRRRVALQLPQRGPAGAVAHPGQSPVVAPGRTEDPLVGSPGDAAGRGHLGPVEAPDVQLAAVPGHVGMVPLQPGEPVAAERRARVGVEVGAGDDHLGAPAAVERHADDLVDVLRVRGALPHADEPPPVRARATVGVQARAVGPVGGEHDGFAVTGAETPQPEVGVVGVDADTAGHPPGGSPVGVHAAAHVGARRGHLPHRPVGATAHEDGPGLRRGSGLGPPKVGAVGHQRGDADAARGQRLRRDRRRPGPVRRRAGRCSVERTLGTHRVTTDTVDPSRAAAAWIPAFAGMTDGVTLDSTARCPARRGTGRRLDE